MKTTSARDAALDAQMDEVRELLTEARGTTKDLRAAIRDGRALIAELAAAGKKATALFDDLALERMKAVVDQEIGEMTRLTREATEAATKRIDVRFDEYTALLMTGRKDWIPGKDNLDLRPRNLVVGEGHPLHGEFPGPT